MRKFTFHGLVVVLALLISAQAHAQDVIDLTAVDNPDILADTLPDLNSGSIVLLKPGMTYNAGSYAFDKSLTLQNSEPSNLNRPKIYCGDNFNFVDGATIDSIIFRNIEFYGEYDARYVLNADVSATVGKIMFQGCYMHDLRGVARIKGGTGTLDHYIIDDCVITMIKNYGILTVDVNTWAANNILLKNSTVSKTQAFLTSRNNTETLTIEGCTFSETPAAGERMFRWREVGQDNVTGGIMVKNTLWGTGWDETATGSTAYDGYDGLGTTTWTFENTYVTSDLDIADGTDSIDGFNYLYADLSTALWLNPASGNLHYADTTFDGIGNAGDQRWAIAAADGSLEWNMSAAAYKYLGTLDTTQKVAGLTIHASSAKPVVIDANNKTLNEMSFTNRLKLGGSGSFDSDGQPLGRVLAIDVKGSTDITVMAMSSSSAEDRILNIAAGHKDNIIAEFPALGASLTSGAYTYNGDATTLFFYSPSSGVNVYYITTKHIASTDATLAGIDVSGGTLTPAFDPAVTSYAVDVPYGTASVAVSATVNDPLATVAGDGIINVSEGSGTATLVVTAEDGITTQTYTVNITVLPSTGEEPEIIDLTGIDNINILGDTLPDLISGSTILLEPGRVYSTGGYAFDKSFTIQSSDPSNLNRPKIDCSDNFNFGEFATVDSIIFRNLEFFGEFDARYVLNSNVSATVGKLMFDGCYIHDLRGVLRMKDAGPGVLDQYVIHNSEVTMIRDYGILTVDRNDWSVNHITLQHSTFSKARSFLVSRSNSVSLVIVGCTLNEATTTGREMFRWRTTDFDEITDGITVSNTIWGPGWDETAVDSTNIIAYDGLDSTAWTFVNTYATSDISFVTGSEPITGFNYTYSGLSSELWYDVATGNFNYADTTFNGIGNAGDQRWSIATANGGREWNISADAYKYLGTLDATQKVAGLTIYANPGKTVTIDANNKTVDEMNFTNRLKLGGSGSFDENGQPLGRVLGVDVKGNTGITVAAMSSSGSEDRVLNIAAGHKDSIIAEFPALGASLTKGVYTYEGEATTLYFYSPSSGVNVYYISTGYIESSDATLSGISLSTGTLTPEFDAAVTAYTAEVPVGTTTVTVSAFANNPYATIEGDGEIDVSSGSGTATITVTAEDGTTTEVYTINFSVEKSDDASLSNLAVSAGILSPFFDAGTFTYSVVLPEGTTSVTVTATANDANAAVAGDGDIDVSSGAGTATVVVTAEDGTTTATYTINFTVITGIHDAQQQSMSVYPTVTSGHFNVDFAGNPGVINIFDLTGKHILQKTASSDIESVYLEDEGMYIFRLENERGSRVVKVVKLK
ncbi:MAG: cadherin-like beta sandwich domain-containing protein [Bacteroidales bacterium]|nr:cadherin-like beta sandwich domain-containing protein [Bacteroidales bacterium]MDT8430973.1 cadherin-like beta sandwich domain-containing protein [Bacteroidales bacterium]